MFVFKKIAMLSLGIALLLIYSSFSKVPSNKPLKGEHFSAALIVSIDGPRNASNSGTYTWTGGANGGTAPYIYEWYVQYGSVTSWIGPVSTQNSYTSSMPLNQVLKLQLVVRDAVGNTGISNIQVLNNNGKPIFTN